MTDSTGGSATPERSAQELQAEVERLKKENETLKATAAPDAGRSHTVRIWRWVATVLLIIFGSVATFGAVGAFWVNRFLMNTDTFVSTLAPLAQDPSVQKTISTAVDDAIFNSIDIQGQLTNLLKAIQDVAGPALAKQGIQASTLPAEALAAPLTSAIQGAIKTQTENLVASPQFAQLFAESLRTGHQAFLSAVNRLNTAQDNGLISFQGDTLYLNVNAFANAVKTKLVASGFSFLDKLPLDRAQGQVKLVQSSALPWLLVGLSTLNVLAWLLPLLALILLAGAILVAPDRRRGILWVGIGIAVAGMLGLLGYNVGRGVVSVTAASSFASAAINAAYTILPRSLVTLLRLIVGIGLLLVLGAVLTGPARWAVSMRTWLSDVLNGSGTGSQVADFVEKWRTPLAGAGVVLGVLVFLLWSNATAAVVFWIAVFVLIWVFLVETIGRRGGPAGSTPAKD